MNVSKLLVALTVVLLSMSAASPQAQTYRPHNQNPNGMELIAIYIGAEFCGPCHNPQLKKAVGRMKLILADRTAKEHQSFSVTGVSTDWQAEKGIKYLRSIGPFDEMVVGKSFFNQAASEFIWKDSSVSTLIPQIVLIEREVSYKDGRAFISNYKVVDRHFGANEIVEWVNNGAKLPSQ